MGRGRPKTPVLQRFEEKYVVDAVTGCWMWTAAKFQSGYGAIGVGGKQKKAHRVAWELFKGPIPEGMYVLHRCDTPACCNVEHLFIGTLKDNAMDRSVKGRNRNQNGEKHNNAKLTEKEVYSIHWLWSYTKRTQKEIGVLFGVCHQTISYIIRGERWKHMT